mgnify:CR=1 FL=1
MPKYRSKFEEQVCGELIQQKLNLNTNPLKLNILFPKQIIHTYQMLYYQMEL